MYAVFVTGLEFYGFHGVSDEEQVIGHRYRIDLEIGIDGLANVTDDVRDTVDYGAISQTVIQIGTSNQYRTVERLAQVIGECLFAQFPSVQTTTISISKPMPPMPFVAEVAGVKLLMNRSE